MTTLSTVIVALAILIGIIVLVGMHYLREDQKIAAEIPFEDDDDIPDDQDELDDDDEEYDDDDDEEYDDDDDDGYVENDRPVMRIDGETIAELAVEVQRDYIREREAYLGLFRDQHPEYYVSVAEYRQNWREEASAYKIAVDIGRAKFRKSVGLAA